MSCHKHSRTVYPSPSLPLSPSRHLPPPSPPPLCARVLMHRRVAAGVKSIESMMHTHAHDPQTQPPRCSNLDVHRRSFYQQLQQASRGCGHMRGWGGDEGERLEGCDMGPGAELPVGTGDSQHAKFGAGGGRGRHQPRVVAVGGGGAGCGRRRQGRRRRRGGGGGGGSCLLRCPPVAPFFFTFFPFFCVWGGGRRGGHAKAELVHTLIRPGAACAAARPCAACVACRERQQQCADTHATGVTARL